MKIKTYEEACAKNGNNPVNFSGMDSDIIAYIKLREITLALNDGQILTVKDDRYEPWIWLLLGGLSNDGVNACCGCSYTSSAPANANAGIGSRICYKRHEDAIYSLQQFEDLWKEWFGIDSNVKIIHN